MPAPKDPIKYKLWKKRLSIVAKQKGFGKWMTGKKVSKSTVDKRRKALIKTWSNKTLRKKMSKIAKKCGFGKWMRGRKLECVSKSNLWRKGKSYKELYGKRHKNEARKRKVSNRLRWKNHKYKKQRDKHNGDFRYVSWRKRVFKRDKYTCQICFIKGGTLNAHHIKSWSNFKELRYVVSNGKALCEKCHKRIHKKKIRLNLKTYKVRNASKRSN